MKGPAREAADQLVRLTRLILRAEGPAAPEPPEEAGASRILRHNQATLTARETEVFGLIVAGHCNALLAELLDVSERVVEQHLATLLAEFGLPQAYGAREAGPPAGARGRTEQAAPRRLSVRGRLTALLIMPVTGTVLVGGAAAAFAFQSPKAPGPPQERRLLPTPDHGRASDRPAVSEAESEAAARAPKRRRA
ncbi:LuxR C-terminal-related transcriptional regulator, partial [Spirillospora sp. NPDC049652]